MPGSPADSRAAEDYQLLRRHEPVLRFTRGELFLPMAVECYIERCSLWRPAGGRAQPERVCAAGDLTPARLAELGALASQGLWLRFAERSLHRRELRAWRRDQDRPRLAAGTSRFAAVGLLSRLIDAVLRLSLLLRGRVPGGTTAAAEQRYRADAEPDTCPYYGRVARDRGYVVLQYWYFYAMNDWRSTFGGVNDHEADWEQVTLFLPDEPDVPAPPDRPDRPDPRDLTGRPTWIAFSSHDEVGDDLRRRSDDPDLEWRDSHPVVYVGAGSHSGGYLPGDYLVTVEPPALKRVAAAGRRVGRLLLPWTRGRAGTAFGIPFIDYRRGDGRGVGPGEQMQWRPVLADDSTPWVRDYRGLWGLDTGDPFGGERAPAGPRYERDGSVRLSWSDPVGWAGLDKEAPSPRAEHRAIEDRIVELDAQLAVATAELDAHGDELRRARVGSRALGGHRDLSGLEASVEQTRARRQALLAEREALALAAVEGLPPADPHAHLRHRAVPNVDPGRTRSRVLGAWSGVSASVLLAGVAVVILGHFGPLLPAFAGLAVAMLCIEAFAQRHLWQFVAGLVAAAAVALAAFLVAEAVIGNWRLAVAVVLIIAAVALLLVNIRSFFVRR
jgi:hypothetical protein